MVKWSRYMTYARTSSKQTTSKEYNLLSQVKFMLKLAHRKNFTREA